MSTDTKSRDTKIIIAASTILSLGLTYLIIKETNPDIITNVESFFSNLFGFKKDPEGALAPVEVPMELVN